MELRHYGSNMNARMHVRTSTAPKPVIWMTEGVRFLLFYAWCPSLEKYVGLVRCDDILNDMTSSEHLRCCYNAPCMLLHACSLLAFCHISRMHASSHMHLRKCTCPGMHACRSVLSPQHLHLRQFKAECPTCPLACSFPINLAALCQTLCSRPERASKL